MLLSSDNKNKVIKLHRLKVGFIILLVSHVDQVLKEFSEYHHRIFNTKYQAKFLNLYEETFLHGLT